MCKKILQNKKHFPKQNSLQPISTHFNPFQSISSIYKALFTNETNKPLVIRSNGKTFSAPGEGGLEV